MITAVSDSSSSELPVFCISGSIHTAFVQNDCVKGIQGVMVGISVALAVEHLPTASVPSATSLPVNNIDTKPKLILLPNLDFRKTIKSNIKEFVEDSLFIPAHLQSLSAPLFTKLGENESVEDLYAKYDCHAEAEHPDLHVDEDTYTFWGRESGKTVDLQDSGKLEDYHILDKSRICLKTLPESLPMEGGRIFVETKDGILPLLGIGPFTRVSELKRKLEAMTGILASQQLLSSVGRVLHDEFLVKDFDGFHAIYRDSVIDLCKSGDSNLDQAHRRMIVYVNVVEEQTFTVIVQPSDLVGRIMQMVESSTGILQWQQRITFSGKILQEKKTLAEYFIYPECTMKVNFFSSPAKALSRSSSKARLDDHSEEFVPKPAARKFKLVRTRSGHVKGTLTIPVLTTDRISDLKRKIKRSLQPPMERNLPVCSSPDSGQAQSTTPKTYPVTGANKFPVPIYPDKQKLVRTTSAIETLVKQMANSVCLKSPPKQSQPSTPTSYFTPPEMNDSPNFFTPPTKLGPSAPASCKASDSAKPSSLVRRLQFGDATSPAQTQSPTFLKQSYSPLRQIFPPSSAEHNAQNQVLNNIQKGSKQHVSSEAEPENRPNQHVVSEKKGLGTWLTQNMHTLKGHIRVTFAEK